MASLSTTFKNSLRLRFMELNEKTKDRLLATAVAKGHVFAARFKGIDHEKYFIIAGLSEDRLFMCSVFINSEIPRFMFSNQKMLNLQVMIKGVKYDFLKYDSFVSCNSLLKYEMKDVLVWMQSGNCRFIGKIDSDDLENITETIISSGLLTDKELQLYFK